ncbi:hypothetical protein [Devosia nitrariae]|nr:hypothetical protein [Devosia nitrariae]
MAGGVFDTETGRLGERGYDLAIDSEDIVGEGLPGRPIALDLGDEIA